MVAGEAWLGETPAACMTPVTSPKPVAASTRARMDWREDTSTVIVLTSNPALLITSAAAIGVGLVQVRQHNLFARTDAAGDCLADRPGSDDNNDVAHDDLLFWGVRYPEVAG